MTGYAGQVFMLGFEDSDAVRTACSVLQYGLKQDGEPHPGFGFHLLSSPSEQ